jgi:hypothetical protein
VNAQDLIDALNPMRLTQYERIKLVCWVGCILLIGNVLISEVKENKYICNMIIKGEPTIISINALNETQLKEYYKLRIKLIIRNLVVKNGSN